MLIAINPGHCVGKDSGACGAYSQEASIVKYIGDVVCNDLKAVGIQTLFIHNNSLSTICDIANNSNADLFVSIHCNSCNTPSVQGTETFYHQNSSNGKKLAKCIQDQLLSTMNSVDRGLKTAGYYVLKHTDMPAVLTEIDFISNPSKEDYMNQNKDIIAHAIARGITDYISNGNTKPASKPVTNTGGVKVMGFRNVTLSEIKQMAVDAKDSLWAKAPTEPKIYLHWSAGHYHQPHSDYHFNIDQDGTIHCDTYNLAETKAHTWKRNSGAIGISFEGCFDASIGGKHLGSEPPTPIMIETMARIVAVLSDGLEIPVDIQHVMTHGEAADNKDGYYGAYGKDELYGPDTTCARWDIFLPYEDGSFREGGELIRGKANWYKNTYPNSTHTKF